jgi:hypothetical protein
MANQYSLEIAIQPKPRVGGPVQLQIVLTNKSNATALFGQTDLMFDWRYELTSGDGSPVPMTRYGEQGRRSARSRSRQGSS